MVEAFQRLVEVRSLLEQSLTLVDTLEESLLEIVIETALQEVNAKIEVSKGDE